MNSYKEIIIKSSPNKSPKKSFYNKNSNNSAKKKYTSNNYNRTPYIKSPSYNLEKKHNVSPKKSSKGKFEDINLGMSMLTNNLPIKNLINTRVGPRKPNIKHNEQIITWISSFSIYLFIFQ